MLHVFIVYHMIEYRRMRKAKTNQFDRAPCRLSSLQEVERIRLAPSLHTAAPDIGRKQDPPDLYNGLPVLSHFSKS
ncbi:MAG: hypothetical protein K0S45_2862 [Nitrospira sp.]|jgi:hypothetical protein|nr:hypothetical protein [Nitrospira sp.]